MGRGVVAPPSVNGNWGHYQPCNGGDDENSKSKYCHECAKLCDHCGKSSDDNKRCTRCRHSFYCNRDCQKADWKYHKKNVCKSVASANEMEKTRDTTRMINMYE